ncbi:hypothetical protein Vafri_9487 [Volvox africanus]|uniref:C3H1-type domain-containing protein n=1 Tax=Volvox africanus TaxID=51714 RepID=A0A8J4B4F2_9CHLO|nr:hypothetical protein Vafri_9487 [Volvox africanus]
MMLLSWGEATALCRRSFAVSYESDIPRVITSGDGNGRQSGLPAVILPSQPAQLLLQQLLRPQQSGSLHHRTTSPLLDGAPFSTFFASTGQRDVKSGHRYSQANRQTEPDGAAARPHAVARRSTGKTQTQNGLQGVVDGLTAEPAGAPPASGFATELAVLPSAWPMPVACLGKEHGASPGALNTLEAPSPASAPVPTPHALVSQQAACPDAGNAAGAFAHQDTTVGATAPLGVGPDKANLLAARPRRAKNELRYLQQLNKKTLKRQQQEGQVEGLQQGPAAKRRKGATGTAVSSAGGAAAARPPEADKEQDYAIGAGGRQDTDEDAVGGDGGDGDRDIAVEIATEGNVTVDGAVRPVSAGGDAVGPTAPLQGQQLGIDEERPLVSIISVRRNRNLSGLASIGVASLVQLAVKRPKNHGGIGGPKPVTAAAATAVASTKLQEVEEMNEEEDAARVLAPFLAGCNVLGPVSRSRNQPLISGDLWAADVAAGLNADVDNGSVPYRTEAMASEYDKTAVAAVLSAAVPTPSPLPGTSHLLCATQRNVTVAAVRTAAAASGTVAAVKSAVAEGQAQPAAGSDAHGGGGAGGVRNSGTALDWLAWAEDEDKDLTNSRWSHQDLDRGAGTATEAVITPFQSTEPLGKEGMLIQNSALLEAPRGDQCMAPLALLPPATARMPLPDSDAASSLAVDGGRWTAPVPATAEAIELELRELLSAAEPNARPVPQEQPPLTQEGLPAPGREAGASAWGNASPAGSDKQDEGSPEVGEDSEGDEGYYATLTRWAPSLVLHPAGAAVDRGIEHYDSETPHLRGAAGGGSRGGQERARGHGGGGRVGRRPTRGSAGDEAPGPQHNPREQRHHPIRPSGRKMGAAQPSAPTDRGKRSDAALPPLASAAGLEVGLYADVKAFQRQQRKARALNGGSGPESTRPVPEVRGPPACKFWRQGRCTKGANCAFAHLGQPVTRLLPCRIGRLGHCPRGEACCFSHDPRLPDPCRGMLEAGTCPNPGSCTLGHYSLEDMDALREYYRDAAARDAAARDAAARDAATTTAVSIPLAGAPDAIKHQQVESSKAGAMPLATLTGSAGNKGLVAPVTMGSWGPGPMAPASGAPPMPYLRPMQPMLQRMVNGGDEDF